MSSFVRYISDAMTSRPANTSGLFTLECASEQAIPPLIVVKARAINESLDSPQDVRFTGTCTAADV